MRNVCRLKMDPNDLIKSEEVTDQATKLANELLALKNEEERKSKLIAVLEENITLKSRLELWEKDAEEDFIIDNDPQDASEDKQNIRYECSSQALSNQAPDDGEQEKNSLRIANCCFNCRGDHMINDCPEPKDPRRIAQNRREFKANCPPSQSRYHIDENQRFGHLKPGLPSKRLSKALGLRDERYLPSYIYKMRELGYPPAWLRHAKINHSGLSMYMDRGRVLGADEVTNGEEGEVEDTTQQTQYDTSKLQEWPGFNILPPGKTKDESAYYRVPPIQHQHSLEVMKKSMSKFEQKGYVRGQMQDTKVVQDAATAAPATPVRHDPLEKYETPAAVKSQDQGTPICKMYSPYEELPEASKWTTNTTDHIFFENLPESTGKYENMVELLKKCRRTRANIEMHAAKNSENLLTPESP